MLIHYTADHSGVSSTVPSCPTRSSASSGSSELPPFDVRASVFIDGTGNNLFNTDAASHGSGGEGSYQNSYSNVARLATNIRLTNSENNYHFSVYCEGMGTLNMEDDSTLLGQAFGMGDTGIPARVSTVISHLRNRIGSLSNGNRRIGNLKIDAFGFSRGAAAARHFVYRVLESESRFAASGDDVSGVDISIYSLIHQLTDADDGNFTISDYKLPFIGLFDTVASYGGNHENDTRDLHLDAIRAGEVERVIHLASGDEHRYNFPLTDIHSAGGKGRQTFLPGVHSDIGGGYNESTNGNMKEDNLVVFEMEDRPHSVDYMNRLYERLNRVKDNLISLGWYKIYPLVEIRPGDQRNELVVAYNQLKASRVHISNRYSWVPLHIMSEKAVEKQLHFDLSDFPLSTDPFLVQIKSLVENNRHDEQHWIASVDPQIQRLRHNYCHFSSHFTPSHSILWPMKPQLHSMRVGWIRGLLGGEPEDCWDSDEDNYFSGVRRRRVHQG